MEKMDKNIEIIPLDRHYVVIFNYFEGSSPRTLLDWIVDLLRDYSDYGSPWELKENFYLGKYILSYDRVHTATPVSPTQPEKGHMLSSYILPNRLPNFLVLHELWEVLVNSIKERDNLLYAYCQRFQLLN